MIGLSALGIYIERIATSRRVREVSRVVGREGETYQLESAASTGASPAQTDQLGQPRS